MRARLDLSAGLLAITALPLAACGGAAQGSPTALSTGSNGEHAEGDEHKDCQAKYDLETLRLAVVRGRHPDGELLSGDVPGWIIGDEYQADLRAYLRSLPQPVVIEDRHVLSIRGEVEAKEVNATSRRLIHHLICSQ